MGRAPCCDKTKVRKGSWSPEEDKILMNYIQQNGTGGNWIALPHKAGLNRCGKSCRLRWLNYLRPDIKHGNFTVEEDYVIYSLYNTIGSRWSVIASNLPGRTDNDVKNYWNTKLKKEIFPSSKNNITTFNNNSHNRFNTTTTNTNTPATTSVQSMSAPVELESQIFDHKDPNFSKFSTDSMDMINYNYYYEREFEHEKMGFDQMDRREKISATNNNSFSGSSSTSVPQISSNSGSGSGLSTTTSSMGTCNALSEDEINNSYNGIAPATTWEENEEMKRVIMNEVATEGGDDEFWMELFLSSSLFSDDQFYTDSDDVIVSGYDLQDKMSEVASILHGSSHHLSSLPN